MGKILAYLLGLVKSRTYKKIKTHCIFLHFFLFKIIRESTFVCLLSLMKVSGTHIPLTSSPTRERNFRCPSHSSSDDSSELSDDSSEDSSSSGASTEFTRPSSSSEDSSEDEDEDEEEDSSELSWSLPKASRGSFHL